MTAITFPMLDSLVATVLKDGRSKAVASIFSDSAHYFASPQLGLTQPSYWPPSAAETLHDFLQCTIWQMGRLFLAHPQSETSPLVSVLVSSTDGAELLFGPQASNAESSTEFQEWQVIPNPIQIHSTRVSDHPLAADQDEHTVDFKGSSCSVSTSAVSVGI